MYWAQFFCFLIGHSAIAPPSAALMEGGWDVRRPVVQTWTGQEVSAPSRGWKVGVHCQWSPRALGSCWTEEPTIICPVRGSLKEMSAPWSFSTYRIGLKCANTVIFCDIFTMFEIICITLSKNKMLCRVWNVISCPQWMKNTSCTVLKPLLRHDTTNRNKIQN